MAADTPRLKDLVTILYRPRQTMRRILAASHRWTIEIAILACVCSAAADKDVDSLGKVLPDLGLGSSLALVFLSMALGSVIWILLLYLFAWMVAIAGRWLGGTGNVTDVRAALAWSLVPLIWSVLYKVPMAIYSRRFAPLADTGGMPAVIEFVKQGGCTLAVAALAFQIAIFVWLAFIGSSTIAEAMRLSTPQGLGALAIAAAAPVVIVLAAVLAANT